MAVVKDYMTEGGARIIIHDDAYAGVPEEEIARRVEHLRAVASRILYNYAVRQVQQQADHIQATLSAVVVSSPADQ